MEEELIKKTETGWEIKYGGLTRTIPYRPTMETLKSILLAIENSKIDQEILEGYVWKGMEVWLSSENQFNYKAAYDLAVQTYGASLPVTFKFGTSADPKYHTFTDLEELTDFYTGALKYVNDTLGRGWIRKDSIDWEAYREALEKL